MFVEKCDNVIKIKILNYKRPLIWGRVPIVMISNMDSLLCIITE